MTPFGKKIRQLRQQRGILQKKMARDLGVSSAYLSSLEHGYRGRPGTGFLEQICGHLDLIWDEAEEIKYLARLSHPRVMVDTSGLCPQATELANVLAETIGELDVETLQWILNEIKGRQAPLKGPTH